MHSFEYTSNPSRVLFGSGTKAKLIGELSRLKLSSPLLLSTPGKVKQAEDIKELLQGRCAGIFSEATEHTPMEVTRRAVKVAESSSADSIVSIGGGSTIGLGKAISVQTKLYHIAIPTTYAGSEVTPILGETSAGQKTVRSDISILPGTVIYDVDLTMTLPIAFSSLSGVNAIAHAVEALYARNANPITNLLAQEGIIALASALIELIEDPTSRSARSSALYGAWLCGICLGSTQMALHHKLCHIIGGSFNLPHAETHTIMLPHTLSYNSPEIPGAMQALSKAIPDSNGDAIKGLNVLLAKLRGPKGLRELGMTEDGIDRAADIAMSESFWNPRKIERDGIRELIRRAWAGEDAEANL
ncbi:putative maleylacetate reductase [Dactylonectria estremocensis]|uniref:Maleylacetate reductase n=1 Tax=Dactylonectria estremocensis TaxID=1079267 RepID=A0A9P9D8G5_9HYPO|nr:putative maleylacetate reductase [Dactylonectria estremocensis]